MIAMLDLFGISGNHFAAINTTEEGTTSGDVTVSSYADIKAIRYYLVLLN